MATEIKTWEIINGKLTEVTSNLIENGRKEKDHLEQWIKTEASVLGSDIKLIGEQVRTSSGFLDYLGIDSKGNLIIVELKRDRLPREALAQAIDYASDISNWEQEKISEACLEFTGQTLDDFISENFEDVDIDSFIINGSQRILLVGFSIEKSLSRMIEWLSEKYDLAINALVLRYIKTSSGNELLSRTAIIPEDIEKDKLSNKKFKIEMSDEQGEYDDEELKRLLTQYFQKKLWSGNRIRLVMLPFLMKNKRGITREELKNEFIKVGGDLGGHDAKQAGIFIALISNQLGQKKNDFLRQIIMYDYPNYAWEKDNFRLNPRYIDLVTEVIKGISNDANVTE